MRISRYIYVPLILAGAYFIISGINWFPEFGFSIGKGIFGLFFGFIFGVIILRYNDHKARILTERTEAKIYEVHQKRIFSLLIPFNQAFELCLESQTVLKNPTVKKQDETDGKIEVFSRDSWYFFGDKIIYRLKKVTENLTEIEITSYPIPRTALVDYGEGFKRVEDIKAYLLEKDGEINKKVLRESAEILTEVFVNPFEKEKVEVKNANRFK